MHLKNYHILLKGYDIISNTVAKNFHYFKSKGWVITFPPDQSERPPRLLTNEIEAVSRSPTGDSVKLNFSHRELKLPRQDLVQLTDQARTNLASRFRLKVKILGVYVISFPSN